MILMKAHLFVIVFYELVDLTVKAEEFNEAVQVVRDWLPQAEVELKFRPISEDEEGIMLLIENHEVSFAICF